MTKKTFICSMCGHVGKCRPKGEAEAELKEEFGDIDKSNCTVVCDDCWEKVRPRNNPKIFDEWKSHDRSGGRDNPTFMELCFDECYEKYIYNENVEDNENQANINSSGNQEDQE